MRGGRHVGLYPRMKQTGFLRVVTSQMVNGMARPTGTDIWDSTENGV
jgi:hypothetical protein